MPAAQNVYNVAKGLLGLSTGVLLDTDDLRAMLLGTSASFDPEDEFVADVVADELGVSGYARQPVTYSSTAVAGPPENEARHLFEQTSFGTLAVGETIGAAIIFKQVTNDSDSVLIAFYDLLDTATPGDEIVVKWNNSDPGIALRVL